MLAHGGLWDHRGDAGGASGGFRYLPHAATGDEGCRNDEQRNVSDSRQNKNETK